MIKKVLEHIGGIENYGIISILIFFACFLGVVVWALTRKRNYVEHMKNLPLAEDGGGGTDRAPSPKHPAPPHESSQS